jgi:hypothetical protein
MKSLQALFSGSARVLEGNFIRESLFDCARTAFGSDDLCEVELLT